MIKQPAMPPTAVKTNRWRNKLLLALLALCFPLKRKKQAAPKIAESIINEMKLFMFMESYAWFLDNSKKKLSVQENINHFETSHTDSNSRGLFEF